MDTMQARANALAEQWLQRYFEKRDLQGTLAMLSPDVVWMGAGRQGMCNGIAEVEQAFEAERKREYSTFAVMEPAWQARPVDDHTWMVCGTAHLKENADYPVTMELDLQFSLLCGIDGETLCLRQVQYAFCGVQQEMGEVFPKAQIQHTNRRLRQLLEQQAEEMEQKTRGVQELGDRIPGGAQQCRNDAGFTMLRVNQGFLAIVGFTREELHTQFHDQLMEMIVPEDRDRVRREFDEQRAVYKPDGGTIELEYRLVRKGREPIWVLDKSNLYMDDNGQETLFCILVDITTSKQAQEALRFSLERHRIIMDQTTDIVFEWDIRENTLFVSHNWEKKFGYPAITDNVANSLKQSSRVFAEDRPAFQRLVSAMKQGAAYEEAEMRIAKADGAFIWCRIRATAQYDSEGRPTKVVGIIIDIHDEKLQAQRLREKAERDTLTGLYNKGTAQALIEESLRTADPDQNSALFIIDIDRFKQMNDTYGHLFGDAVLTCVASELTRLFRAGDILGRVGGDEFVALARGLPDASVAEQKAQQVQEAFRHICVQEHDGITPSCSLGIAMSPACGKTFVELFEKADQALYQAKNMGRDRYQVYEETMTHAPSVGMRAEMNTAVNEQIDSNVGLHDVDGRIMEYVFRVLYNSLDIDVALPPILDIVGRQFDVSRVYIFENSPDGLTCSNTFEWCGTGVRAEKHRLQKLPYANTLWDYHTQFDADGVFYCRDVTTLPETLRVMLEEQNVKAMLQCAIRENGHFRGFVGFDECRSQRWWTQEQVNALNFIAQVLGTFLLKKRMHDMAQQTADNLRSLLDAQERAMYVVAPDTWTLLYVSDRLLAELPDAREGERCYETLYRRTEACTDCPLRRAAAIRPEMAPGPKAVKGEATCRKEGITEAEEKAPFPEHSPWKATQARSVAWNGKRAELLCGESR